MVWTKSRCQPSACVSISMKMTNSSKNSKNTTKLNRQSVKVQPRRWWNTLQSNHLSEGFASATKHTYTSAYTYLHINDNINVDIYCKLTLAIQLSLPLVVILTVRLPWGNFPRRTVVHIIRIFNNSSGPYLAQSKFDHSTTDQYLPRKITNQHCK